MAEEAYRCVGVRQAEDAFPISDAFSCIGRLTTQWTPSYAYCACVNIRKHNDYQYNLPA